MLEDIKLRIKGGWEHFTDGCLKWLEIKPRQWHRDAVKFMDNAGGEYYDEAMGLLKVKNGYNNFTPEDKTKYFKAINKLQLSFLSYYVASLAKYAGPKTGGDWVGRVLTLPVSVVGACSHQALSKVPELGKKLVDIYEAGKYLKKAYKASYQAGDELGKFIATKNGLGKSLKNIPPLSAIEEEVDYIIEEMPLLKKNPRIESIKRINLSAPNSMFNMPLRVMPMVPGTIYSNIYTKNTYKVDAASVHIPFNDSSPFQSMGNKYTEKQLFAPIGGNLNENFGLRKYLGNEAWTTEKSRPWVSKLSNFPFRYDSMPTRLDNTPSQLRSMWVAGNQPNNPLITQSTNPDIQTLFDWAKQYLK